MNLRDLEYFVAVAELGHFGRAAERCFCTQPTLSGQLRRLEEELGAPLFERSPQRVALTPFGEKALQPAREALEAAGRVGDLAKTMRDPLAGEFVLAAIPTIGPYLWPSVLRPLAAALPAMRFLLREEQTRVLLESLRSGSVDAGILAFPLETTGLETVDLWEEPFLIAAPAGHPVTKSTPADLNALNGAELLLLEEGHCLRDQALEVCALAGALEREGFRATSLESLREMVRFGIGITLLPESAARPEEGLALIPFRDPPKRRVGLAWRRGHAREAAIDKVAKALLTSRG